jgi:hypothetical protein
VAINQIQAAKDYPTEPSAQAIPFIDDEHYHSWSPNAIYAAESAVTTHWETCKSIWPALPLGATPTDQGCSTMVTSLKHFINPSWEENSACAPSSKRHYLMSRYYASPSVLVSCLEERIEWFTCMGILAANPCREATEFFRSILSCHLSYDKPTSLRIPLPMAGPSCELLVWVTGRLPQLDCTSFLAHGTYDTELFIWSSPREEYEIVLDDLNLEDMGVSLG